MKVRTYHCIYKYKALQNLFSKCVVFFLNSDFIPTVIKQSPYQTEGTRQLLESVNHCYLLKYIHNIMVYNYKHVVNIYLKLHTFPENLCFLSLGLST